MSASSAPRLLLYNGFGHGLGHRERVIKIATAFVSELPHAEALLVTAAGDGLARRLPPRVQHLALNRGGVERGAGRFELSTPGDIATVHAARARAIRDAAAQFQPDLVLVEHLATGMLGELLETFELLGALRRPPRLVLGLREILYEPPAVVHEAWERDGVYEEIATRYDSVLVYGCESLLATAARYGFADAAAGKLAYCGYVGPVDPVAPSARDGNGNGNGNGTIVVTGGGGADAYPMMARCVAALRRLSTAARAIFVAGPAMSDAQREALVALASGTEIEVRAREEHMPALLATADVVISMGGYNTLTEAIAARCRVLVMPREWTSAGQALEAGQADLPPPGSEQLLRAELFAQLGLVDVIAPAAGPEEIAAATTRALQAGAPQANGLPLDGAARAARELRGLLG